MVVLEFELFVNQKSKKLQAVEENNSYDAMSSSAWADDKADDSGKLDKPERNRGGKRRAKRGFKRNKVAPAAEKDEAWSKTSRKTLQRAANKDCPYQEIGYTKRMEFVEEDGKMTLKTSCQKWDLTTGKKIKLDIDETRESSSSLGTDLSQFLNVLNAPATDNFYVCNSDGSSCDLFSNEDNGRVFTSGFSGRLARDNRKSRENSCSSYSLKVKRVSKLQCNSY